MPKSAVDLMDVMALLAFGFLPNNGRPYLALRADEVSVLMRCRNVRHRTDVGWHEFAIV
ncbi:MAG: hypothetical protein AAGJ40_23630 [Planctomycetota bacterium]